MWIPYLQQKENEQIEDCQGFRDDGRGVSQMVLEKCNTFFSVLLGVSTTGIPWHPVS